MSTIIAVVGSDHENNNKTDATLKELPPPPTLQKPRTCSSYISFLGFLRVVGFIAFFVYSYTTHLSKDLCPWSYSGQLSLATEASLFTVFSLILADFLGKFLRTRILQRVVSTSYKNEGLQWNPVLEGGLWGNKGRYWKWIFKGVKIYTVFIIIGWFYRSEDYINCEEKRERKALKDLVDLAMYLGCHVFFVGVMARIGDLAMVGLVGLERGEDLENNRGGEGLEEGVKEQVTGWGIFWEFKVPGILVCGWFLFLYNLFFLGLPFGRCDDKQPFPGPSSIVLVLFIRDLWFLPLSNFKKEFEL